MIALLRSLAVLWLAGGTLLFRDVDLRAPSVALLLVMSTLGMLPAAIALLAPLRWIAGRRTSDALTQALTWATAASLIGLVLPYVLSGLPPEAIGIGFRLAQAAALLVLLADWNR